MKVTAIKPAFVDGRRVRVGDVVEVADDLKGSWFTKDPSHRIIVPQPDEPKALSQLNNVAAQTFTQVHAPKAEKVRGKKAD